MKRFLFVLFFIVSLTATVAPASAQSKKGCSLISGGSEVMVHDGAKDRVENQICKNGEWVPMAGATVEVVDASTQQTVQAPIEGSCLEYIGNNPPILYKEGEKAANTHTGLTCDGKGNWVSSEAPTMTFSPFTPNGEQYIGKSEMVPLSTIRPDLKLADADANKMWIRPTIAQNQQWDTFILAMSVTCSVQCDNGLVIHPQPIAFLATAPQDTPATYQFDLVQDTSRFDNWNQPLNGSDAYPSHPYDGMVQAQKADMEGVFTNGHDVSFTLQVIDPKDGSVKSTESFVENVDYSIMCEVPTKGTGSNAAHAPADWSAPPSDCKVNHHWNTFEMWEKGYPYVYRVTATIAPGGVAAIWLGGLTSDTPAGNAS